MSCTLIAGRYLATIKRGNRQNAVMENEVVVGMEAIFSARAGIFSALLELKPDLEPAFYTFALHPRSFLMNLLFTIQRTFSDTNFLNPRAPSA
jgi:hypothetical protein